MYLHTTYVSFIPYMHGTHISHESADHDSDGEYGDNGDWWGKKDVFAIEGVKRTFSDIVHSREAHVEVEPVCVSVSLTTTFR
jgi:hypothetical protein